MAIETHWARLEKLRARRAAEDALGLPAGFPAASRFLMRSEPEQRTQPVPSSPSRREIQEHARRLAEQLMPLPDALRELTTRIARHCASRRDEELATAVEAIRRRTWTLFLATQKLASLTAPSEPPDPAPAPPWQAVEAEPGPRRDVATLERSGSTPVDAKADEPVHTPAIETPVRELGPRLGRRVDPGELQALLRRRRIKQR